MTVWGDAVTHLLTAPPGTPVLFPAGTLWIIADELLVSADGTQAIMLDDVQPVLPAPDLNVGERVWLQREILTLE